MNSILKNEGRKPEKTQVWKDSSLCPEILTKNAVQEFHLRKARKTQASHLYM